MNNDKWCTTVDGKEINLFDPDPSIFTVDRIANALARINRFAGHWHNPVSVARHSMRVADILRNDGYDTETQLQGLFHDAAEAFTTDIPSPLKKLLSIRVPSTQTQGRLSFGVFEDGMLRQIFNCLEIVWPLRLEVEKADKHLTKQECSWVKVENAGNMPESSCLYSPRTSTNPYVVAIAFRYKADALFAVRLHAADMPAGTSPTCLGERANDS